MPLLRQGFAAFSVLLRLRSRGHPYSSLQAFFTPASLLSRYENSSSRSLNSATTTKASAALARAATPSLYPYQIMLAFACGRLPLQPVKGNHACACPHVK